MCRIILIFFLFPILCFTQSLNQDSLLSLLDKATHDTTRCRLLFLAIENETNDKVWPKLNEKLLRLAQKKSAMEKDPEIKLKYTKHLSYAINLKGFQYNNTGDMRKAMYYYKEALRIRESTDDLKGVAESLNNIGTIYDLEGDVDQALSYYLKSKEIREKIGDKKGVAHALNGIGLVYKSKGDLARALECYHESLRIRELLNDKRGIASNLTNLANILSSQGNNKKALEYNLKALEIREGLKDKGEIALSLNNIGVIYRTEGEKQKAMDCFKKCLALQEEINDRQGMGYSLQNIATIYSLKGDHIEALEYYRKSLGIREAIHDKKGISLSLYRIAKTCSKLERNEEALIYAQKSLRAAEELGFPEQIKSNEELLALLFEKSGEYGKALTHYKKYIKFNDSINNATTRKASITSEMKYEFDKKEAVLKEQQEKERELNKQKGRQSRVIIYSVGIGLMMLLIFAAWIWRSLRIVKIQKELIEEKQKEIIDSINYARRIQSSLMASEGQVSRMLNRSGRYERK